MNDQTLRQFQEVSALLNSSLDHTDVRRRAIEAATVVMDAEAGSLLLLDETTGELYFDVAHGEKGHAVREVRLRFGEGIAGDVARTGEPVIVNDVQHDPRFFRQADEASGFTTRNMVCVPVKAHGRFLGVLQAINRKNGGDFSSLDLDNFVALGHQVGIAIENANLYQEIQLLFEGFISASVQAIESRDPSTSGHSQRVAALTCRLAEAVSRTESGPYARIRFGAAQLKEIRYAAVLHDFGKVGVREHILVKAKKLHPGQLALVKARFDLIKRTLETESLREKLALYETAAGEDLSLRLAHIDRNLAQHLRDADEIFATLLTFNQPTHDGSSSRQRLAQIAAREYRSFDGPRPYLTDEEVQALSGPGGSLTTEERREIERHVTHTFEFLSKIPWMRSLKYVPEIAWCHHERLDGSGYPRGLTKDSIPIQARMMAICDIFDALTASDRPYKSAISLGEALQQLDALAQNGKIDPSLLEIFVRERVHEATHAHAKRVA
jgi:HD-GYP domain-containing protein (c-di-GMP phosphodiesterase class II)